MFQILLGWFRWVAEIPNFKKLRKKAAKTRLLFTKCGPNFHHLFNHSFKTRRSHVKFLSWESEIHEMHATSGHYSCSHYTVWECRKIRTRTTPNKNTFHAVSWHALGLTESATWLYRSTIAFAVATWQKDSKNREYVIRKYLGDLGWIRLLLSSN